MKLGVWKYFLIFLCCLVSSIVYATPTQWQTLAPGLEYTHLTHFDNFPAGSLHAFRIDLQHYQLKSALLPIEDGALSQESFQHLMADERAVVATNGGFFTPELQPLGLRITDNQIISPHKAISWWGVFFVHHKTAHLVREQYYQPEPNMGFAIEAGPLLISEGRVLPEPNQKIDSRTAIGVTTTGKVVLVATENVLLSVADLATLMQQSSEQGGLDCVAAMNLDGGHSTQMYARVGEFSLQVPNSSRVGDAVLVVPVKPQNDE